MKNTFKILVTFAVVVMALRLSAQGVFENYVDGEIYLKIKDNYPIDNNLISPEVNFKRSLPFLSSFEYTYGIQKAKSSFYFAKSEQLRRVFRIQFSKKELVEELISALNQLPEVEYVEKIPLCKVEHTPNDLGANTINPGQYSLHLTQAQGAWDIIRGDPGIVVAIVDNAIQTDHPDLVNNMVGGWDVSDGDNNPNPPPPPAVMDHGTHCAGIAGATSDNGLNVASIGHGISIMPVKATSDVSGPTAIDNGFEGIAWAATNGADVISNSWTSSGCLACELAVATAQLLGSTIVAAAGNNDSDTPRLPADYAGVIAVANTNISDVRSGSSNFGSWIDVSAPGENIQSLVPFDATGGNTGTSMSCPFVAGLIGLALSARDVYNPGMSDGDVVNCVLSTADNLDAANPTFIGQLGSGRVNAYEALKCVVPCPVINVEPFAVYPSGLVRYRQASEEVHSTVECDGCELTHNSGGFIRLTPPFHIKAGSEYWGHIEGCGGGSKPSENRLETVSDKVQALESHKLLIAPNPFDDLLSVRFEIPMPAHVSLALSDAFGRTVTQWLVQVPFEAGEHTVQMEYGQLPPGLYYLTLSTSDGHWVQKVVKGD
ncbi:MAG: S8 family serine peptidase [Saprospiraceae bacterium]